MGHFGSDSHAKIVRKSKKISSAEITQYLIQLRNTFFLLLFFAWLHRRGVEKKGRLLWF
jgi:hypothetical protein